MKKIPINLYANGMVIVHVGWWLKLQALIFNSSWTYTWWHYCLPMPRESICHVVWRTARQWKTDWPTASLRWWIHLWIFYCSTEISSSCKCAFTHATLQGWMSTVCPWKLIPPWLRLTFILSQSSAGLSFIITLNISTCPSGFKKHVFCIIMCWGETGLYFCLLQLFFGKKSDNYIKSPKKELCVWSIVCPFSLDH